MFRTLLAKEFCEQWRTWKMIVFLVVFLITGITSPLLAKYTPELLRSIPNMPAGLADFIPAPSMADSIAQYLKNTEQFGILLVILLTMGTMAQEKERGTAAMLLSKPVSRSAVILAKWLTGMTILLAGLLVDGLACLVYTVVLFESIPLVAFWIMNLLLFVCMGVYLSVTLMASTLASSQTIAAAGAFGGLVVLLILGSIPRVSDYMPGQLPSWGSSLVLKADVTPAWTALGVAVGIIALALLIACLRFEREEI
jgi:ABC-2 type transport system permease protein